MIMLGEHALQGWRQRAVQVRLATHQRVPLVVINHVTLDGVMQGQGRRDEDTRGGFAHGGWAFPRGDDVIVARAGERMGRDRAFLFGRRTYEELLASWNAQGGPFMDALNNTQKYVASHSPATRLGWPNSTLLGGDVPATVAELKQASSSNLVIMGSGGIDRRADGRRPDR
jgi:dihydrofolate reductase